MKPLAVLRSFTDSRAHETYFWPAGATLADAGYRLTEEEAMTAPQRIHRLQADPDARIRSIMASKGISYEEAAITPEGAQAYAEYRTRLHAQQSNPRPAATPVEPSRFDEARGATSQRAIDALRDFEEQVAQDARERCRDRGVVADAAGIARMTAELVAEDNSLYDRYSKLQRSVAAGG
jgi:hypothetical protein